jgi:hypothetical protein
MTEPTSSAMWVKEKQVKQRQGVFHRKHRRAMCHHDGVAVGHEESVLVAESV